MFVSDPIPVSALEIQIRVVGGIDGDTLEVLHKGL